MRSWIPEWINLERIAINLKRESKIRSKGEDGRESDNF